MSAITTSGARRPAPPPRRRPTRGGFLATAQRELLDQQLPRRVVVVDDQHPGGAVDGGRRARRQRAHQRRQIALDLGGAVVEAGVAVDRRARPAARPRPVGRPRRAARRQDRHLARQLGIDRRVVVAIDQLADVDLLGAVVLDRARRVRRVGRRRAVDGGVLVDADQHRPRAPGVGGIGRGPGPHLVAAPAWRGA
jgi:hypothetical protein